MVPATIRIILDEHAALAAMLRSLVMMLKQGPDDAKPEAFFDVLRAMLFYIDEFPERQHHPKESGLLFPKVMRVSPDTRPTIEQLTKLPVTVLNSHTHFDHVGANYEFTDILGLDTPFTREHERGRPHADIADEVESGSFCGAPPTGVDTATFRSHPFTITRRVANGDTIDIGNRKLVILAAPGHTPDAIALLDPAHGLLWTGDSYYDSTIWLFSPGTDLAAYEQSMTRLAALVPSLHRLLPAHNTATADPSRLTAVVNGVRTMRAGGGVRTPQGKDRVQVRVGDVTFMIAK